MLRYNILDAQAESIEEAINVVNRNKYSQFFLLFQSEIIGLESFFKVFFFFYFMYTYCLADMAMELLYLQPLVLLQGNSKLRLKLGR